MPLLAGKVVITIARTIRVNTEELWDAAKRYERLAANIEDYTAELDAARANLVLAYSRDDYLLRLDAARRKAGGIAYRLRDLGGKLMFAANRYDEFDRRMKEKANSAADSEPNW